MKDYRNPECRELCGANPNILRIKETSDGIEEEAINSGCISVNGEINCPGLKRTIRVTDSIATTGLRCAAAITTPEIMHPHVVDTANEYLKRIMESMSDLCEFE